MKTFTVTLHHSTNYGASLQAYALQQAIQKLGHENTIFEYPYDEKTKLFSGSLGEIIKRIAYKGLTTLRSRKVKRLKRSFREFHSNRMQLSRIYTSYEDLKKDPPQADVYIAGSDQVWNIASKDEFTWARFLDFGNSDVKRISYAASIEKLNYTEDDKAKVRAMLSKFSSISLREENAAQYIHEITGKDTCRVLDPIFLLNTDEWGRIAKKPRQSGPYILVYQVLRNEQMQGVVDRIKKQTGYPVVSICHTPVRWINSDYTYFDVSPEEFIGFYQNASIVVSASFHGTAFGLLFGKPTYGLVRKGFGGRIQSILSLFDLEDYCITGEGDLPDPIIDNDKLKTSINSERDRSVEYLKKAIDG